MAGLSHKSRALFACQSGRARRRRWQGRRASEVSHRLRSDHSRPGQCALGSVCAIRHRVATGTRSAPKTVPGLFTHFAALFPRQRTCCLTLCTLAATEAASGSTAASSTPTLVAPSLTSAWAREAGPCPFLPSPPAIRNVSHAANYPTSCEPQYAASMEHLILFGPDSPLRHVARGKDRDAQSPSPSAIATFRCKDQTRNLQISGSSQCEHT